MCLLALAVSFELGWKVLADTPWPAVNFVFGVCFGFVVYLVARFMLTAPWDR